MIDASHCKVYPHAAGEKGGNQTIIVTIGVIINIVSALSFLALAQFDILFLYFLTIFFLYISFPLIFSILIGQAMHDSVNKVAASAISSFICMIFSSLSLYISRFLMLTGNYTKSEPWITLSLCILINIFSLFYIKRRWPKSKLTEL